MPKNPQFADWYRTAGVAPPERFLDSRWAGAEQFAQEITVDSLLGITKLFVVPRPAESFVPDGFRKAFQDHDDTFASQNNLQELKALAGAVLRILIDEDSDASLLAALAVACGAFGPRELVLSDRKLVHVAERFLLERSRSARVGKPEEFSGKLADLLPATLFAANQTPGLRDPLVALLEQLVKHATDLQRRQQLQSEDLEILWWLQTQFSRELNRTFPEVGPEIGSLVFPFELADLTVLVPGAEELSTVLVRALLLAGGETSTKCHLAKSVNLAPRDWREKRVKQSEIGQAGTLTPVLVAIQKSLDTDGLEDWQPAYRKCCDIPLDQGFLLVKVALQVFREQMLLRAIAEAEL